MKVAFMFGGMNRGGAETLMLDVFQNHRDADFDMIGIHRKGGVCKDAFYQTGIPMFHVFPRTHLYISYFVNLRRCIKQKCVDIIHTQHWLDCIYAKVATLGLNVKIVNTFHGFYKLTGIEGDLCRLSMHWADAICFVSNFEKKWYQRKCHLLENKLHTIYNGIDFTKFEKATELATPLPLCSGDDGSWPKLVMVGSFGKGRTQKVIVKAIELLNQEGVNHFEFYFIGARNNNCGYLYDDCVNICQKEGLTNVHFLGGREDIPAILKQMDGFIYSTHHDTFGIAVVEAMAAGVPVIVNDWSVMEEITENGQWATLFRTEDIEDCTDKIEGLLKNMDAYKVKAQSVAEIVQKKYFIKQYLNTLYKIYNSLLK